MEALNREQTESYLRPVIHAEVRCGTLDETLATLARELVAEAVLDGYRINRRTVVSLLRDWRDQLASEANA